MVKIDRETLAQATPAEVPGLVIDQLALELTCGRVLLLAVCDLEPETRTELAHCLQLVGDQLDHARNLVTP